MAKKPKKESGCTFLGIEFPSIKKDELVRNIAIIAFLSLITKFVLINVTTGIFQSFIDLFDISLYLEYAAQIAGGQIPYIDFSLPYPILFLIPALLPLPFALITQNAMTYVFAYQAFMSLFDIVIAILVYFIALKIHNKQSAFIAGIMYATAFSAAYFTITKYDAFPTMFLMLGLMMTIYGMKNGGYVSIILGFFAKMFSLIALPYTLLFNSEKTDLKSEIIAVLKYGIPVFIILLVPVLIISPSNIMTYLSAAGSGFEVYVNTPTYTIHALLLPAGIDLPAETISIFMYLAMVILGLYLLATAYIKKIGNEKNLLAFVFLTIFITIFFSKFHSPQYLLWISPFIALFLVPNYRDIVLFYLFQAVAYIEFPLMWGGYYMNHTYTGELYSANWYTTLVFFIFEYLVMLYIVYRIITLNGDFKDKLESLTQAISQRKQT